MDRGAGNRKPYDRCLVLAGTAIEYWAATEAIFARAGLDARGFTLRHWLVMYEALLRERMDAERQEEFDAELELLAPSEPDPVAKRALMEAWGGEVTYA